MRTRIEINHSSYKYLKFLWVISLILFCSGLISFFFISINDAVILTSVGYVALLIIRFFDWWEHGTIHNRSLGK